MNLWIICYIGIYVWPQWTSVWCIEQYSPLQTPSLIDSFSWAQFYKSWALPAIMSPHTPEHSDSPLNPILLLLKQTAYLNFVIGLLSEISPIFYIYYKCIVLEQLQTDIGWNKHMVSREILFFNNIDYKLYNLCMN